MPVTRASTVVGYIDSAPAAGQPHLRKLYALLMEIAPDAMCPVASCPSSCPRSRNAAGAPGPGILAKRPPRCPESQGLSVGWTAASAA